MNTRPPNPYAKLSLRDRLELLAFEAELAGFPRSLIQVLGEAIADIRRASRHHARC